MVKRTNTYVAFDGDADLMCYRTIQRWSADPKDPFHLNDAHDLNNARDDSLPESIIAQLKKRLDTSRHLLLIIGQATNLNRKGILQYEIRYALRYLLPIFLVFKHYDTQTPNTSDLWKQQLEPKIPKVLRESDNVKYCLVCPFTRIAVKSAIATYSDVYRPNPGYTWFWR